MAVFRSPGLADPDAPASVLDAWNRRIASELGGRPPSPILVADPKSIPNPNVSMAVKWPGHPLEPLNCLDEKTAEQLCDWGWAGRAELHNEYLEYGFAMRPDATGKLRPKRFIATTELMEWWLTMAVHAPEYFLDRVKEVSGVRPSMSDLFGVTSQAWLQLGIQDRENRFARVMVGDGRNQPPQSGLNPTHLLFMEHQINGLDDLIFVVHFGAFPYAVTPQGGAKRRARIEEIFHSVNRPELFCRNADPAAAEGAYNQAFLAGTEANPRARKLALEDPLGMYIRTFSSAGLFLNGNPVPDGWTRRRRGSTPETTQRLEFGPADNEAAFLDEVTIGREPGAPKVTGYQLAKRLEVGPIVVVGDPEPIPNDAFKNIPEVAEGTITCGLETEGRCRRIAAFKREFDEQAALQPGTRGGRIG